MKVSQQSIFLSSIIPAVSSGAIVPAAMQRPYVWEKEDVLALFDSILSQFPVGGFLCWEPCGKADLTVLAKGRLGPVLCATEPGTWNPHRLLLDGQNRLATLAWAMHEGEAPAGLSYTDVEQSTWLSGEVLVLDGASQSVIFVPEREAGTGLRLPIWAIGTSSLEINKKANRLIRKRYDDEWAGFSVGDRDCFIDFVDASQRAFSDARVTMTIIEDATPEEAKKAFLRICRVGVAMSEEDFSAALQWSPSANPVKN